MNTTKNLMKGLGWTFPLVLTACAEKVQTPPNILIAIADDASYPHMSAYGCTFVNTPGFDRVAREGILFNNAYTPNAKSSPSRASLLTGRYSWQLEEAGNHVPFFPVKYSSVMEELKKLGYFTGYTAKGWAPGVARDSLGKPRELTGKAYNAQKASPPATGISNNDYASNFSDFLAARDKGKPFIFWYGSTEPHRRYEYGSGIMKGGKSISEIGKVFSYWPDNDTVRTDMLDYAFEIEHFDAHLQRMIEILEEAGELANTIIIVTADNGMPFPRAKGNAYEISNHMPLAIMWPAGIKKPGRVVDDYVSFVDIVPTILDAAGIDENDTGLQPVEGKSFTDIFSSGRSGTVSGNRNYTLIGHERHDVGRPNDEGYPVRGIIMDGFLYLVNFKPDRWPAGNPETGYLNTDGSPTKTLILAMNRRGLAHDLWEMNFGKRPGEELYNIVADPECVKNIAGMPEYDRIKRKLHDFLVNKLTEQDDPRIKGNGDIFDNYPYAEDRNRHFHERFMKGEIHRNAAGWVDSTDFEIVDPFR